MPEVRNVDEVLFVLDSGVDPNLTSRFLLEVVDLLVGYEEWICSDIVIELLPTWRLENVRGPLWS